MTDSLYGYEEYHFVWKYQNTYDSKRGKADVVFTKAFLENEIFFKMEAWVRNEKYSLSMVGLMDEE